MQPQTSNEVCYRQVVTALGIGALFFLLFLLLISGAVAVMTFLLAVLPLSPLAAKLIYQFTYSALYLAAFLCPIPIMKALMRSRGLPWQAARTRRGVSRYLPLIVLGGITIILAQSYLNAGLVNFFDFDSLFDSTLPSTEGKMTGLDLLLSILVMAAVPAFCEEFLFRGAILGNLLPFGRETAVLVSALAFGLMHQNPAQFLYAFGAGILLGTVYERTGSIWNCVALHFCNNATSVLATALPQWLGEEKGTVVLLILDAVPVVLGLISIVFLTRRVSRKTDVRDGAFGRSLPQADGYATYRVAPARSVRLLLASPFGVFLIACAVMGILTMLMLMLAGSVV